MLTIKESRIKGAGKGLFTTSKIRKGDLIVEYLGEKLTWSECEKRNEKAGGHMGYFFFISNKNCIDASNSPEALARYANDAEGKTRLKNVMNNSNYQIIKSRAYIVATKAITPGSEIFVEYGKEYWETIDTPLG